MGEGSRGLGKNQRGLRVGYCEMLGDYYDDSSVKENLNLLLRLARVETNVDSKIAKGQGILEGRLQGTWVLGASAAAPSNDRLRKRFKGLDKECTLGSSAKTQRDPVVKGELSRFKLRGKYRKCRRIYIWRPGARTKQCS